MLKIVFKCPDAYPTVKKCGACGDHVFVAYNPTGFYLEGTSTPVCDSCVRKHEPEVLEVVELFRLGCAVCCKGSPHDGGGVIWNECSWICDGCVGELRGYQYPAHSPQPAANLAGLPF